jgi:class 3 adenylate cyclase
VIGLFIFYERSKAADLKTKKLKMALEHTVPPAMLQEIIRRPESLEMRPTSDIVSVMFIDIAGFSLTSERQDAKAVFANLKEFNSLVRRLVHAYGGVVDKALGDGVLAYFGHSLHNRPAKSTEGRSHAEMALQCAAQIQQENVRRSLAGLASGRAVYPLRIGINTANVYIGNLGDENKIEFTIVGDGVNFAKRLEEGCEMFKILIGRETRALIGNGSSDFQNLERRLLRVKHHEESHREAYEYDPFPQADPSVAAATKAYQDAVGIVRTTMRWELSRVHQFAVKFDGGEGQITSVSEHGLGLETSTYFARSVELTLDIGDENSELARAAAREKIFPLTVEVRWGRKVGPHTFAHGLRIKSLNSAQKAQLQAILLEFSKRNDAKVSLESESAS